MKWSLAMRREILLPDLGVADAVLSVWFADVGSQVYAGDRLVEVLAGAATFDVASPATGRLVDKIARIDDRLQPGQVLGIVEETET
jgi:pyruvate/2-oxoglutarate dehydrogenase complex dihydrolipoamide acyltransferase (E2) component